VRRRGIRLPRKYRLQLQRRDALNRQTAILRIHERGTALRIGHSHRGYILGIHWLAAAYERICAGEPEREVLADFGYEYTYKPPKGRDR
jgi:hypothetical protein